MSFETICTELPMLNRSQLEEVRKRCALLLKSLTTQNTGGTIDQDWLLEGILWWCERNSVYVHRGFHLKRSGSFSNFASKSETLRELLLQCCAADLSPVQRAALGQVAALELAQHLAEIYGSPPNFKLMMDQVHQTVEALQASFPGLMESKLLNLVVRYDDAR